MLKKATIIFVLVLITLLATVGSAIAQNSVPSLVAVSNSQLSYFGVEGVSSLNRTISIIGIVDENVNVTVISGDLYNNNTGKVISSYEVTISPPSFSLSKGDVANVSISLETVGKGAGTYQGVILVTATTTTTNVTISNIAITANIESKNALLVQYGIIFVILVLIAVALLFGETDTFRFTKFVVVVSGLVAVGLWLVSIVTSSITDTGNIISTILIAPFIGYVIYYVKDKREDRRDREKTSRTIRNTGIAGDIDILRNLMGEITAHYSSFISVYDESGLVSRKAWDSSRKQGIVLDVPLLRLEEYYHLINSYNRYYLRAAKLTKEKKKQSITKKEFDYDLFDEFRKAYAELEKILFVNLQYDLGWLSNTCLSPLKVEYPRSTRTLLFELVDCGALKPPEFVDKEKYKDRIRDWELGPRDFQKINEQIYRGENTQKFLKHVDEQFKTKYHKLIGSFELLPPLPEDSKDSKNGNPLVKGTFTLDVDEKKEGEKK
ncbi:MAG: hypothetical protein ABR962_04115 [Candidatus Bathyarchaeia archaeon]|jgi:hypothetical protein